jgi:hypothetical protein
MSNPEGFITATDKIHELVAENNRLRDLNQRLVEFAYEHTDPSDMSPTGEGTWYELIAETANG